MTSEEKNAVSHRGKAGRELVKFFQEKLRATGTPLKEAVASHN